MTAESVGHLTEEQRSELLALVRKASDVDGFTPLSEQVLLAVVEQGTPSTTGSGIATGPRHFLSYEGGQLAGYAHLDWGPPSGQAATAEVVVDPAYRRRGLGTALVRAVEQALQDTPDAPGPQDPTLRLWSHGDLDATRALALHHGYANVRELWQMRRPLQAGSAPLPAVSLHEGFSARHFVVGQDEQAWLRVNARAFADHPEQGRMTRADLDARIAEPWFDATGFILIEDLRGAEPVLVASHWTKVVPVEVPVEVPAEVPESGSTAPFGAGLSTALAAGPAAGHPRQGEVYVVGVNPAYQGHGLGRTVTVLGLTHLRDQGLTEAMLYVDADNLAAVATYTRLDFVRSATDIMYSRTVHTRV